MLRDRRRAHILGVLAIAPAPSPLTAHLGNAAVEQLSSEAELHPNNPILLEAPPFRRLEDLPKNAQAVDEQREAAIEESSLLEGLRVDAASLRGGGLSHAKRLLLRRPRPRWARLRAQLVVLGVVIIRRLLPAARFRFLQTCR